MRFRTGPFVLRIRPCRWSKAGALIDLSITPILRRKKSAHLQSPSLLAWSMDQGENLRPKSEGVSSAHGKGHGLAGATGEKRNSVHIPRPESSPALRARLIGIPSHSAGFPERPLKSRAGWHPSGLGPDAKDPSTWLPGPNHRLLRFALPRGSILFLKPDPSPFQGC